MAGVREPRGATDVVSSRSFAGNLRRALVGILNPRDDECRPQPNVDLCEKPGMSTSTMSWIIVGAVLGLLLVTTGSVLIYLHIRKLKRDKREDVEDRFQMADYGLDELPASGKPRADDDTKSTDGSTVGYGRRSREPLQAATEPKYHPGQLGPQPNPFDDGSSLGPSHGAAAWPKREGHQPSPLSKGA